MEIESKQKLLVEGFMECWEISNNKLTTNQIILLLDISRGTQTQTKIGTTERDVIVLVNKGYITAKGVDISITDYGRLHIEAIKQFIFK